MANKTTSIVLAALMILSVFAAGVGTVAAAGDTEVSVTPANSSVDVGDTQTFDIVVDSGTDGTQGYNVTVELTNGSVAKITSADTRGSPALEDNVSIDSDNDSVTVVGGYLTPISGSQSLKIATVTVESTAEGSTDVQLGNDIEIRDDNNRKYTITGTNAATMTVTDPSADFQVSNLAAPNTVMQGDTLSATTTVSNVGSVSGTETVEFSVGGSVVASTNVTLAAGASQNVTLSTGTSNLQSGNYSIEVAAGGSSVAGQVTVEDPSADFRVSNLAAPNTVMQGDTLSATATVSNVGSVSGTETVEFSVGGSVVASTNVTLAAGASQNVTLSTGTSNLPTGGQSIEMAAGGSSETGQVTISDTTVSLDPQGSTTTIGNTQTYDVLVDQGSDGSQGYALRVDLSNATVAEIISADTAGSPGLQDNASIDSDGDTVNITGGYFTPLNGSEPLTIATVTVEGMAEGTAQLSVDSSSEIRDGNNDKYVIGGFNPANVTVISSGPAFQVSNLDVPSAVMQGDTISASATITNVGTAGGTETVEFSLGGNVIGTANVNLSAGASQNVTLSASTSSLPVGQQTATVSAGSSSSSRSVTIAETDLSVEPPSAAGSVGSVQTFDIVVDRGSDGSQGYNVTVQLSNGTVGEITNASTVGTASLGSSIQTNSNNDSVNIEAGYASPLPGAQPLTIATVTVEATAKGSTDVMISSTSEVRNGSNSPYVVGSYNSAQLLVGQTVTLPNAAGPAQSIDSDPLLEDVDGDGNANVFDSITLYNNLQQPVVQNNPQFFDFDGDGKVDVFDAIALYNKISASP